AWLRDREGQATRVDDARHGVVTREERVRSEQRRLDALDRQRQGVDEELALRRQRLTDLDTERQGLVDQVATLASRITELERATTATDAELAPLETGART